MEAARKLRLTARGFELEPEITGGLLNLGYHIYEVPVRYRARSREEGKKLTWQDGVKALGMLTRVRLRQKSVRRREADTVRAIKERAERARARDLAG